MTDTTENREYNVPEGGDSDWHIPVNENWEAIDDDVQSLFEEVGETDGSGGSGLPSSRTNVGALAAGSHHANGYDDGGYGVAFAASDLYIHSVVVDSNLSDISDSNLTIELRQYEDGADDPTVVESTTVELSGGPERVEVGFTVPESGSSAADANDEYVIQRGAPNGDEIPLRRRFEDNGDWSVADYDTHTYTEPDIDFLRGVLNASSSSGSQPVGSWYYFFDWLVGSEVEQLPAPWSTDIDELYMRPRPPEEEFDDVSPRALWIDTS